MADLQYIDPNQATPAKKTYEKVDTQDKSLVKKVNKLMQQSMEATKDIRTKWADNYKFAVKGEQWSLRRPRHRFAEVFNLTWANIMTEVGIQTDSYPKFDFNATDPDDYQFAEVLKQINDLNWNKPSNRGYGWQRKVATGIFKSKIYDVVHAEVAWNPKLEDGLGDVDFKILDPFGCYWDPLAESISEARYFIYAKPEPTEKLKRLYPEYAEKIKPDVESFGGTTGNKNYEYNLDKSTFSNNLHAEPIARGNKSAFGGEEMTLLLRCWLKDDTTIEELVKNDKGEEEYITKLEYPKGRYIEIIGDCLVHDGHNQYEDGLFPIATLVNYDYGEYCGENEVTHFRGPQKLTNYTLNHIMDQFKSASAPQKIVSERAAHVINKLTDEPGLKVVVPDVSDIRYEAGPGVTPSSFNVLDTVRSLGDQIQGMQDASRGATQPGVTSGLMLEGFVEAAQTRPRLKNRSVEEFLRQVGFLMASRYLQYYTVPRTFRITNKEGFPEYVTFYINKNEETQSREAKIKRQTYQTDGKPFGQPEEMTSSAKGIPDIDIVSGSNLPYARAQKTATALDLQSRGAITLETMLEAINWPNAKQEAQKVQEQQQAMAQQAAQGQPQ